MSANKLSAVPKPMDSNDRLREAYENLKRNPHDPSSVLPFFETISKLAACAEFCIASEIASKDKQLEKLADSWFVGSKEDLMVRLNSRQANLLDLSKPSISAWELADRIWARLQPEL